MVLSLDTAAALLARPAPVPAGQLAIDDGPRIGSLCSGYRGLDMAVEAVFGGTTAWVSDIDPGASKILAHHWPEVPNLGDLTTTDWAAVEPVEIVCGGYPCQPFSTAGLRKGTDDARHIWPHIARALGVLRPRHAIFENVAGHLRLGFDTVLTDLAALGFDAEWCLVRASEVGAAHQRERLILLATAADAPNLGHNWARPARNGRHGPANRDIAAADPAGDAGRFGDGDPLRARRDPDGHKSTTGASAPADADRGGREPDLEDLRTWQPDASWGRFAPAIHRWAHVLGRPCPPATDALGRLNPALTEWLMGLPAGHVTGVPDLTRTAQLKALGNGVVPQQATAALRLLAGRAG